MFKSPPLLRSGRVAEKVPLSATTDKQGKVQRSLSSSSVPSEDTATMSTHNKSIEKLDIAFVESCVNKYLSSDDIFNRLVTKLTEMMTSAVETAVRSALSSVNSEMGKLRDEVSNLTGKVVLLEDKLAVKTDELEQYQRRNNLRIHGLEEVSGEDTDAIVADLCRNRLSLDLPTEAISRSHRVGKQQTPGRDGKRRHRPIIVQFTSYQNRRLVFNSKKRLKGSGITITEDLTAQRAAVYRRAVELHGVRRSWTMDGRVQWLDKDGRRGVATRMVDLDLATPTVR